MTGTLDERGAVAVITNAQGQVLLHLRDDIPGIVWPGYWSILGGGCDPNEHPDEAIVRELDEEANLGHVPLRFEFEIHDDAGSQQLLSVYSGIWEGDASVLPLAEGQELRFIDHEHIRDLKIPGHIMMVLERVLGTL
jgi:8-oxo-dGTP diphosphatase